LADNYLIGVATLLLKMCGKWLRENDKFLVFGGALKQLERQLGRQTLLQRRIRFKKLGKMFLYLNISLFNFQGSCY
jgi:hypothetical protein